jgi:hypothetical protein
MERLKELIDQLKEQFEQKAVPSQMLETTRLLDAELRLLASQPAPGRVMPTKIAVMMPSSTKIYTAQPAAREVDPAAEARKDLNGQRSGSLNAPVPPAPAYVPPVTPAPVSVASVAVAQAPVPAQTPVPAAAAAPVPAVAASSLATVAPVPATAAPALAAVPSATAATATITLEKASERGQWPFDPLAEKPTDRFTLSQRTREVNDVIGNNGTSSLNDKLKSEVVDLKSTLNDAPVRDLKKAIGLNDRYVFINQLFRGDEVMYERSLKTINGFRILPEAEYWMERELKVKLGWDENREATRHFYQLVKRRFS